MAKNRTKKQKQNARHAFTLSWEPTTSEAKTKHTVKSQFKNEPKNNISNSSFDKYPMNTGQTDVLIKTRKNIIKSLILAGVILGTQLVLYFFLN